MAISEGGGDGLPNVSEGPVIHRWDPTGLGTFGESLLDVPDATLWLSSEGGFRGGDTDLPIWDGLRRDTGAALISSPYHMSSSS